MRRMKLFKRLLTEDSGQSFVIVALAVVVLFGATGMAIDIGHMYSQRTNLQQAVDAGALAGAQTLAQGSDTSTADYTATTIATRNISTGTYTPSISGNELTVTGKENVPTWFARLLGISEFHLTVAGTAAYGPLGSVNGGVPLALLQSAVTGASAGTKIDITNSQSSPGNWGYLDLTPQSSGSCLTAWSAYANGGQSPLDKNMACGSGDTVTATNTYTSEPGQDVSQLAQAIDFRISEDSSNSVCSSWSTATTACNRVVIVPVVTAFGNGKKDVPVVEFAELWLQGYTSDGNNKGVVGILMKSPVDGPVSSQISGSGYTGPYAVGLVK